MYTKNRYSVLDVLRWTRWEICLFAGIAAVPTALYEVLGWHWLQLPWIPISLLGTAVAFLLSFQSSAAYGRIWEARKIWGGIVNTSRAWCIRVLDQVTDEHAQSPVSEKELASIRKTLIHRHLAWVTALRHAMRQGRPWEVSHQLATNREWEQKICTPETVVPSDDDLREYLSEEEMVEVAQHNNRPAAILKIQSRNLRELKRRGLIWEFSFLELENTLTQLLEFQGKSERIKNFPYPRQFATLGFDSVRIFIVLLPFGVIPEFAKIGSRLSGEFPTIGSSFVWLSIPFAVVVSWVFHTIQRIGKTGENPFEGSVNDVPISTISRTIEIDLRQMMSEDPATIPKPFPGMSGVQM